MTANGSVGATQGNARSPHRFLTHCRGFETGEPFHLKSAGKELSIANSLWVNDRMDLSSRFLSRVRKNYQAEARNLDFHTQKSTKAINDWVSDATRGAIDGITIRFNPM
jgi:serpin B